MPEPKLSDAERAAAIREICRELLNRKDEPDLIEKVIERLGPYFPDAK
jgi:hypothetical protein